MSDKDLIVVLTHDIVGLRSVIADLKSQLKETRETLESVCVGEQLECGKCGKYKPCLCDK
jgi:succinate dehydrogenase hydrophobic anchor subunit